MNRYYVYCYLDPREPGKYSFCDISFDYKPFYVGKGTNNRCNINSGRNSWVIRTVNKLRSIGNPHILVKLKVDISEIDAYAYEEFLIKLIGTTRSDEFRGPLLNNSLGGIGPIGLRHTDESRKRISISLTGKKRDKSKYIGENNPFHGRHHTEDTKRLLSEKNTGYKFTEERLAKMRNRSPESYSRDVAGDKNPMYGKHHSDETRKALSDKASSRTGDKNSFFGKTHSEETISLIKTKLTGRKLSEETKQKMRESRRKYLNSKRKDNNLTST